MLSAIVAVAAFDAPSRLMLPQPAMTRAASPTMSYFQKPRGEFPVPGPPADFDGAQWAPHVFPGFKINVPKTTVAAVKELLDETPKVAAAPVEEAAPAAAPAAPADPNKKTFTVTLKNPDGDQIVEYDPASDMSLLDYLEELDNADDYADLPYACRAGSCSACAAKIVSGTMDVSACSFLSDEQKADGWVLTCTAKPTSDVVLETHKEDDMY